MALCAVCKEKEQKYTCRCATPYCSVACYKEHKTQCPTIVASEENTKPDIPVLTGEPDSESDPRNSAPASIPLRPLTSLRWPYIPEAASFQDPLTEFDPKPLNIQQYQAIATSSDIRGTLSDNPRLVEILRSLDSLRPNERDVRMQQLLGIVNGNEALDEATLTDEQMDDARAFQSFAAAVQQALRPTNEDGASSNRRGLDWSN
ncbi:hypothetical protein DL93DRAFT_2129655 [Clavulina sp. PMI_390]|nr:hypothetical protein DL93DRAFT_2129655 [Clavulina sp. PMI_390]